MCKQFEIAKETVLEFIDKNETFSVNDLKTHIIKNGGVLRISPDISVSDYLNNLEERKIIFYNSFIKEYDFYDSLSA